MAVYNKAFQRKEFFDTLSDLKALNSSMMYYIFPFNDLITVEFRKYNPSATGDPDRHVWALRNYMWATAGPKFAHDMETNISIPALRYQIIDSFAGIWRFKLENIVRNDNTVATDQIIRYPTVSDDSRYTFSLFAFPEERYPEILTAY